MSKSKKLDNNLLTAILYIAVGILFCIFKASVLNRLLTIAGVLFIVQGVLSVIRKDTVSGAISLVLGLLLILGGWLFVEIIMIIFGILILVKGVTALMNAINGKNNVIPILVAGLTIFVGILLIVSRWAMLDWFFVILGIIFIIDGVLALFGKQRV